VRVEVEFTNLSEAVTERIASHIRTAWPKVTIRDVKNSRVSENADGSAVLIIRGDATSKPEATSLITRKIIESDSASVEETIFQVDAKLAMLTNTEVAMADRGPSVKGTISRRDFLFGMMQRHARVRDEPFVSESTCEAKFGCSKCVDVCPAPGALMISNKSVNISNEHCVRCGLCATACPVAAIQVPQFTEGAYRALLATMDASAAPKKTLVITCQEASVRHQPWMDVEEVQSVGVIGIKQLAFAADSSIGALVVYCPDASCVGREQVNEAVKTINSITGGGAPVIAYLEGEDGAGKIGEIHASLNGREKPPSAAVGPWKDYVKAVKSISKTSSDVAGLGFTEIEVKDSCTLCNACVDSCPHHALAIQTGELTFYTEECTGCGYCEEICPERSITLSEMAGPIKPSPAVVYRDEMIKCSSCGTPYASAKMLAKVSTLLQTDKMPRLCPACKEKGMYQDLFPKPKV